MRINVAKSSGFCSGVKRALDICHALLGEDREIYVLGEVVHNRHVVNALDGQGLKRIDKPHPVQNAKLVISAHGTAREVFNEAKKCGFEIVDATCPKVKEIYAIARRLEKERLLIIIGDKDHDEVKGIAGQLENEPVIAEGPFDKTLDHLASGIPVAVVTQSTQSQENVIKTLKAIEKRTRDIEFVDTTCRITRIKQREIQKLPEENDAVFIIGSRGSANTRRLYEISKEKNNRTYWLEDSGDLTPEMLENIEIAGVMAGASTPDDITEGVIARIKELAQKKDI